MHVHNGSAPGDTQREIVDWSAHSGNCRRGNRAAGRPPAASGHRARCPERPGTARGLRSSAAAGSGPLDGRRQDVLGRHYGPPARQKVFEDVHPPPGPPVTSLETSTAILGRLV